MKTRLRPSASDRLNAGAALIIIAVVSVVVSVIGVTRTAHTAAQQHDQAVRLQRISDCQTRFNNAFAKVTTLRGQLSDEDRSALLALITTVFTDKPGPSAATIAAKAYTQYRNTEERITEERAQNPFPVLPSTVCK